MKIAPIWAVIHDCDLDDGTPTEWCTTLENGYAWIDLFKEGFVVSSSEKSNLVVCKSLTSAKRWVAIHLA